MARQFFRLFVLLAATSAFGSCENLMYDLRLRGPSWRQSPFLSFCGSSLYRQTEETCNGVGFGFNAAKCRCVDDTRIDPQNRPVVRLRHKLHLTDNEASECLHNSELGSSMDIEVFKNAMAFANNEINEFHCSLHMGPVIIPQPSDHARNYMPIAIPGPVCVGLQGPNGESCQPYETYQQQVRVFVVNRTTGDLLDPVEIGVPMPVSCHMAPASTANACENRDKYRDAAGQCRCLTVVSCAESQVWDADNCRCRSNSGNIVLETTIRTEATTELACLRQGGCTLGFGPAFNAATGECFCSCHVENFYAKRLCDTLMKMKKSFGGLL